MVNNNYLADILRVCEIKDLIWVMRFKSPLVYFGGGGGGRGGGLMLLIWSWQSMSLVTRQYKPVDILPVC